MGIGLMPRHQTVLRRLRARYSGTDPADHRALGIEAVPQEIGLVLVYIGLICLVLLAYRGWALGTWSAVGLSFIRAAMWLDAGGAILVRRPFDIVTILLLLYLWVGCRTRWAALRWPQIVAYLGTAALLLLLQVAILHALGAVAHYELIRFPS